MAVRKGEWRNRIVGSGEADPETLMPNPLNWRTHPALQRDALAAVLGDVGWVQQVVVNKRTGHLIDGHLRVDMARGKGEKVPYVEVDLSEDEERLILATLDPLGALASMDPTVFSELLAQVENDSEAVKQMLDDIVRSRAGADTPEELFSGFRDGMEERFGGDTFLITFEFLAKDKEAVMGAIGAKGKEWWRDRIVAVMSESGVD